MLFFTIAFFCLDADDERIILREAGRIFYLNTLYHLRCAKVQYAEPPKYRRPQVEVRFLTLTLEGKDR